MFRELVRLGAETDIVVAHGHAYIGSAYAAHAARTLGKPFVLVQHAPFIDYPFPLSAVERLVDRTLGAYVIRAARRVVAVSTHTEQFVRSIAPKADTIVVQSGVDQDRFHPPDLRKREGDLPVVLTVRRLVPRNGVDVLVRAWRGEQLGDRAELVIAGDGPERSTITELAAGDSSIRLMGYVSDDALADLYRSSDVFVLPSRSGEGFGLVAAEAMATGLPVVATESGGVTDLVQDGVNGVLVPSSDPASLGQAIRVLVDDAGQRSKLSRGALDTASSLSWDRSLDRLERILVNELT
jgi:glycosyltransferase involved in cell wall biosynthesis